MSPPAAFHGFPRHRRDELRKGQDLSLANQGDGVVERHGDYFPHSLASSYAVVAFNWREASVATVNLSAVASMHSEPYLVSALAVERQLDRVRPGQIPRVAVE